MDSIIKLNDFFDSMLGMVKKIAMAAVVLLAIAGVIAASMWPLVLQHPWEFAGAALAVLALGFLVGAGVTLLVSRGKVKTQIEARDKEIAELKNQIEAREEKVSNLENQIAEQENRPTQERAEQEYRAEVLAKIGATSDTLSPAAFSILEKMTDDEAACMVALANIAQLAPGTSDPEKPLVILPASDYYKQIGITDDLVDRLENAGVVSKCESHNIWTTQENDNSSVSELYTTRSSFGYGGFVRSIPPRNGDPYVICVPRPPLAFTPYGKEIAKATKMVCYQNAVEEFKNEAQTKMMEWINEWLRLKNSN